LGCRSRLLCSVAAHAGPRVGVASGDLNVAKIDSCVQHGRHERVAEHVRVHASGRDACGGCQVPESSGGGVTVHTSSGAEAVLTSILVLAGVDPTQRC
jgi:hypothetical protein